MSNGDHTKGNSPIEHVIVLMLENRSFDHILGVCKEEKPEIEGIAKNDRPRTNSYERRSYAQVPGAARIVIEDPRHETPHVLDQLKPDGKRLPSGYVSDYATAYLHRLRAEERGEVMKYHDLGSLPAWHKLAKNFAVCDHWFGSVPGPTWTNRLFAMSGTSLGRVEMPEGVIDLNLHWYDQSTLFDRLNEGSIDWKVYYGDVPLSLLLVHQWEPKNLARHHPMTKFYSDVANHPHKEAFPKFAWIEPAYLDPGGNSGHPPHDILAAEALIANVYNALRANEIIWETTLLIVLCDEHGGFYDHIQPPACVPPDHYQDEYTFDRLGPRVPAILVSPWMPNTVIHDVFDHTSILRYTFESWNLMPPLTRRASEANSFGARILSELRTDTPTSISAIPDGMKPMSPLKQRTLSSHEKGLIALSHALETMSEEDPAIVAARSKQTVTGPQSQIDVAVERVEAFIKRGAAAALKEVEN